MAFSGRGTSSYLPNWGAYFPRGYLAKKKGVDRSSAPRIREGVFSETPRDSNTNGGPGHVGNPGGNGRLAEEG
jgi:hypothetical protein